MSAGLSARPSFFEVYAAEQLNSTLRPAFRYVLEVLSLRNPSLVKLASWSDEIFSGLLLVLESSQLRRDSALLSESFYSLRRSTRKSFESKTIDLPLSTHHVLGSILYAIIIPHIRTKLDAWYATRTGGAAAAMLQDTQNTRHPTYSSQVSSTSSQNRSRPRALRLALDTPILSKKRLRTAVLILIRLPQIATSLCRRLVRYLKSEAFSRLLMFYYPMIRAVTDGINMMFGVLYLYGHSRYYNLSLALQGLILRRVNDTDLLDFSSILSNSSSDASNNASDLITNILGRIVSVLRIAFFTSIFGFRFLQYYYAAEVCQSLFNTEFSHRFSMLSD